VNILVRPNRGAIQNFLLKIFLSYPILTIKYNKTTGKGHFPGTREKRNELKTLEATAANRGREGVGTRNMLIKN
jgi:hypothetical protein